MDMSGHFDAGRAKERKRKEGTEKDKIREGTERRKHPSP